MPTPSKKAKKCQTMTYMPNTIFSCQTTFKKAKFPNFGLTHANLATLFGTPNFPTKRPKIDFFERILFSSIPAVGEAQNRIGKTRRDAGTFFSHLLRNLPKFQYGNSTNMDFSQKQTFQYLLKMFYNTGRGQSVAISSF